MTGHQLGLVCKEKILHLEELYIHIFSSIGEQLYGFLMAREAVCCDRPRPLALLHKQKGNFL